MGPNITWDRELEQLSPEARATRIGLAALAEQRAYEAFRSGSARNDR
jgi:hypothetical protein